MAVQLLDVRSEAPSTTGTGATAMKATAMKGPRAVAERRDESVHSSKQKIQVVLAPQLDNSDNDDDADDLVE